MGWGRFRIEGDNLCSFHIRCPRWKDMRSIISQHVYMIKTQSDPHIYDLRGLVFQQSFNKVQRSASPPQQELKPLTPTEVGTHFKAKQLHFTYMFTFLRCCLQAKYANGVHDVHKVCSPGI
jgi:hypothetical protein